MTASEEERGTVKTCAECGKKIRVPAAKPADKVLASRPRRPAEDEDEEKAAKKPKPSEDEAGDEEADDKPRKKKKKKRGPVSTVNSVFGGIGALVGLALFILIVSGKWVDIIGGPLKQFLQDQGIPEFIAIGAAGLLLLLPIGLWVLLSTKSAILNAMPVDLDFVPAKLAKFEDLDGDKLERLTEKFEALGFTKLMDYTVQTELDTGTKGFGRLFVNKEDHCFGEINVVFRSSGDAIPMRCNFMSFLEDGWSVAASNRTPQKEGYLLRRPRAVWRSFPGEKPAPVFEELLKLRKKMTRNLEVAVLEDDDAESYFAQEKAAARERKEVVRHRWAFGILIEFWLFDRNPKLEWLGEYGG